VATKYHNGTVDEDEPDPRTQAESDADGQDDGLEGTNHNGLFDAGETNGRQSDTDHDGIADGDEDANDNGRRGDNETDSLNPDTAGGGEADGSGSGISGRNVSPAPFGLPRLLLALGRRRSRKQPRLRRRIVISRPLDTMRRTPEWTRGESMSQQAWLAAVEALHAPGWRAHLRAALPFVTGQPEVEAAYRVKLGER